ncbi:MAG: DUF4430 domain-containing protein [Lachnospiraceae bacterium]|nr:DUF4430 domain-containing protein [Lachnospiraceae bacterium]
MLKSERTIVKKERKLFSRAICAGLVCLCLFSAVFSLFNVSSFASNKADIREEIFGTYRWKMALEGEGDLQSLIDNTFCDSPLNGTNQNYILSIIQNPAVDADFSKYSDSLKEALYDGVISEEGIFPTSLQKSLATYCIVSGNTDVRPEVLEKALYGTIGEKGIMSYVYGLYMMDVCRFDDASFSREEIISELLKLQKNDGGFTLAGDEGDTDVTAMTLQVLAPAYLKQTDYYKSAFEDKEGKKLYDDLVLCVDKAVGFLSSIQGEDGDYASFGTYCSESSSQVILALKALNISILGDERFKSENADLLKGLMIYKNEDGGFIHSKGTPSNDMASSQSALALTAICSELSEEGFDKEPIPASDFKIRKRAPLSLKVLIPAIGSLLFIGLGIFRFIKRKKIIHLISALVVSLLFSGVILALDIRSKSSFENEKSHVIISSGSEEGIDILFSINADTIDLGDIYPETDLRIKEGSTVFDVLKEVCRLENIQFDYEKNSVYGLAYIKGINSVYEYEHGDLSGWMYRVNGEMPNIGVGYYKLSDGDKVEILYSKNIGRDLE